MSFVRLKRSESRIQHAIRNGKYVLNFGPTSLNLMMADTCNSQCIMCGDDYRSCGTGDSLTLEKVKTIYRHLDLSQMVDVIYGGGGEPFLNKDLADIAAYTKQMDPVIQHTVISNMIKKDPETCKKLLSCGVHFLVSLNAATRETYHAISGVDAFEAVKTNIRSLVELRNASKSSSTISLSLILMKTNIHELCTFVELARSLQVDKVKTLYVRIYPESYRKKNGRSDKIQESESLYFYQNESDQMVREAKELASKLRIGFEHEPLFSETRPAKKCQEPWKSLFVGTDGDVYPCAGSEILFKNKVKNKTYNCGNLLEQDIHEFWNNTFWQVLRRTNLESGNDSYIPECCCCGNMINLRGPDLQSAHVLNWTSAEKSDMTL